MFATIGMLWPDIFGKFDGTSTPRRSVEIGEDHWRGSVESEDQWVDIVYRLEDVEPYQITLNLMCDPSASFNRGQLRPSGLKSSKEETLLRVQATRFLSNLRWPERVDYIR